MHFAAVASVPDSIKDPDTYWTVNTIGTKNVLDSMRAVGVEKLLFSSTAATYSFFNEMPLTEASVQDPQVPYGTSKLAAEWLIKEYCRSYRIGYTILRYFNASGADPCGEFGESRKRESHLIPSILYTALGRRDKVLLFGDDWETRDGTCIRDFVHTSDLGQAHQLAVENIKPGAGSVYNLGNGVGTTVLEVLRACEDVVGRAIPNEVVHRRPGDPAVLIATPRKIQEELGWSPQFSEIEQIVETAWRWHSNYPQGYDSKPSTLSS